MRRLSRGFAIWGLWAVLAASVVTVTTGCEGKARSSFVPREASHIQNARTICQRYLSLSNGRWPSSLDVVEEWAMRTMASVTEDTFTSTRDYKPYVLIRTDHGPVLHEQTGLNGQLYACDASGPAEWTPAEVQRRFDGQQRD